MERHHRIDHWLRKRDLAKLIASHKTNVFSGLAGGPIVDDARNGIARIVPTLATRAQANTLTRKVNGDTTRIAHGGAVTTIDLGVAGPVHPVDPVILPRRCSGVAAIDTGAQAL